MFTRTVKEVTNKSLFAQLRFFITHRKIFTNFRTFISLNIYYFVSHTIVVLRYKQKYYSVSSHYVSHHLTTTSGLLTIKITDKKA